MDSHINVSGVVLSKYTKHKANSLKLIEFMSGESAQKMYASLNMEYPVKSGVALSDMVASWGKFSEDAISLHKISENRTLALKLIDEVKFDL